MTIAFDARHELLAVGAKLQQSDDWQFQRIELGNSGYAPLEFLVASRALDSMLYSSKAHSEVTAGVGLAAHWDDYPPTLPSPNSGIRCFACLPFQQVTELSTKWSTVPTGFFIPQFEADGDGRVACNLVIPPGASPLEGVDRALAVLGDLFQPTAALPDIPVVTDRSDSPTMDEWERSVEMVLACIGSDELKKVVLARETEFQFKTAPNPLSILAHLMELSEQATIFMFRSGDACFLGASPELLYTRQNDHIASHAIAATRSRGATEAEDDALAQAILSNSKELHEHALVTDMIVGVLKPFCSNLTTSDLSILKLPHVQHLYRSIEGQLKDGVSDSEILAALHPTPAVGGTPRHAALAKLAELERFDRGCYASPVGYVTPTTAEFHVAIRSALVLGNRLCAYAGAGLVAGSDSSAEWAETEKKMSTFTSIVQHD